MCDIYLNLSLSKLIGVNQYSQKNSKLTLTKNNEAILTLEYQKVFIHPFQICLKNHLKNWKQLGILTEL